MAGPSSFWKDGGGRKYPEQLQAKPKLIELCATEAPFWGKELEPADVEYYRRNQTEFFQMLKEQGPEFWTYFMLSFRGYVFKEVLPKMPETFVKDDDKAHLVLDWGLARIYSKWMGVSFEPVQRWMQNVFLLAKAKYQFANFKTTPAPISPSTPAVLLDPFHAPLTADCFRDFFGPPTTDLAYLKAFLLTPLILRYCGTLINVSKKWRYAVKIDKKSVVDHAHIPDCWSPKTSFALFLREMLFGSPRGMRWFIPPGWNEFDNPRLTHPDNPLYNPKLDGDWRMFLTVEEFAAFHDYVAPDQLKGSRIDSDPKGITRWLGNIMNDTKQIMAETGFLQLGLEESCTSVVFSMFRCDELSVIRGEGCRITDEDMDAFKRFKVGALVLDPRRVDAPTLMEGAQRIKDEARSRKEAEGRVRILDYPVDLSYAKRALRTPQSKGSKMYEPEKPSDSCWPQVLTTVVAVLGKAIKGIKRHLLIVPFYKRHEGLVCQSFPELQSIEQFDKKICDEHTFDEDFLPALLRKLIHFSRIIHAHARMSEDGLLPELWPERSDFPKIPVEVVMASFEKNVVEDRARTYVKERLALLGAMDADAGIGGEDQQRRLFEQACRFVDADFLTNLRRSQVAPGLDLWNLYKEAKEEQYEAKIAEEGKTALIFRCLLEASETMSIGEAVERRKELDKRWSTLHAVGAEYIKSKGDDSPAIKMLLEELRSKETSLNPKWDDVAECEADLKVVRRYATDARLQPILTEMRAAVEKTIQLRIGCEVYHNVALEYFKPFCNELERTTLAMFEDVIKTRLVLWQVDFLNVMVDAIHALDMIVALDVNLTRRNLETARLPPMELSSTTYYGVQAERGETDLLSREYSWDMRKEVEDKIIESAWRDGCLDAVGTEPVEVWLLFSRDDRSFDALPLNLERLGLRPLPPDRAAFELRFYQFGDEYVHKPVGICERRKFTDVLLSARKAMADMATKDDAVMSASASRSRKGAQMGGGGGKCVVFDSGPPDDVAATCAEIFDSEERIKKQSVTHLRAAKASPEYVEFHSVLLRRFGAREAQPFVKAACERVQEPILLLNILYGAAYEIGARTVINGVPPMFVVGVDVTRDEYRKLRHNVALYYCHFVDDADVDEYRLWSIGENVEHLQKVYFPSHEVDLDVQPVFDVEFAGRPLASLSKKQKTQARQRPCIPYQWTKRYVGYVEDSKRLPSVLQALRAQILAEEKKRKLMLHLWARFMTWKCCLCLLEKRKSRAESQSCWNEDPAASFDRYKDAEVKARDSISTHHMPATVEEVRNKWPAIVAVVDKMADDYSIGWGIDANSRANILKRMEETRDKYSGSVLHAAPQPLSQTFVEVYGDIEACHLRDRYVEEHLWDSVDPLVAAQDELPLKQTVVSFCRKYHRWEGAVPFNVDEEATSSSPSSSSALAIVDNFSDKGDRLVAALNDALLTEQGDDRLTPKWVFSTNAKRPLSQLHYVVGTVPNPKPASKPDDAPPYFNLTASKTRCVPGQSLALVRRPQRIGEERSIAWRWWTDGKAEVPYRDGAQVHLKHLSLRFKAWGGGFKRRLGGGGARDADADKHLNELTKIEKRWAKDRVDASKSVDDAVRDRLANLKARLEAVPGRKPWDGLLRVTDPLLGEMDPITKDDLARLARETALDKTPACPPPDVLWREIRDSATTTTKKQTASPSNKPKEAPAASEAKSGEVLAQLLADFFKEYGTLTDEDEKERVAMKYLRQAESSFGRPLPHSVVDRVRGMRRDRSKSLLRDDGDPPDSASTKKARENFLNEVDAELESLVASGATADDLDAEACTCDSPSLSGAIPKKKKKKAKKKKTKDKAIDEPPAFGEEIEGDERVQTPGSSKPAAAAETEVRRSSSPPSPPRIDGAKRDPSSPSEDFPSKQPGKEPSPTDNDDSEADGSTPAPLSDKADAKINASSAEPPAKKESPTERASRILQKILVEKNLKFETIQPEEVFTREELERKGGAGNVAQFLVVENPNYLRNRERAAMEEKKQGAREKAEESGRVDDVPKKTKTNVTTSEKIPDGRVVALAGSASSAEEEGGAAAAAAGFFDSEPSTLPSNEEDASPRFRVCSFPECGKIESVPKSFRKCAKCAELKLSTASRYCGEECQAADWKLRHRVYHKEERRRRRDTRTMEPID